MRRIVIGVMGGADPATPPEVLAQAETAGRLIAEAGAVLLCGGRTGVMEAAARGAKSVPGGETLAVLPGSDPDGANPFIDLVVATGMGNGRNIVNVLTSDAVIAFPGGPGTLSEMALALKCGIHVAGCASWDLAAARGAASGDAVDRYFHPARSPREAVETAFRFSRHPLPAPEEREKEILAFLEDRARAWGRGDSEAWCRFYAPVPGLALVWHGRRLSGFEEGAAFFEQEVFSNPDERTAMRIREGSLFWTLLPGRAVLAVYGYALEGKKDPVREGLCTVVMARAGEGYMILGEHATLA